MNIIEAIKSGKKFKRPYFADYWVNQGGQIFSITLNSTDILADDWEIEEEKVEVTKIQLWSLYELGLQHGYGLPYPTCSIDNRRCKELKEFLTVLGFKE